MQTEPDANALRLIRAASAIAGFSVASALTGMHHGSLRRNSNSLMEGDLSRKQQLTWSNDKRSIIPFRAFALSYVSFA
jgi:hypothetical protein